MAPFVGPNGFHFYALLQLLFILLLSSSLLLHFITGHLLLGPRSSAASRAGENLLTRPVPAGELFTLFIKEHLRSDADLKIFAQCEVSATPGDWKFLELHGLSMVAGNLDAILDTLASPLGAAFGRLHRETLGLLGVLDIGTKAFPPWSIE